MPCGAILCFDDETDAAIRGLWQVIEDAGQMSMMPGLNYPPHMTLVVCENMQFSQVREQTRRFVAEHPPMPVHFNGLGVFNAQKPVVHLSITADRTLLDLHTAFEELTHPYMDGVSEFSRTGMWVPHVTLNQGFERGDTGAIIDALQSTALPQHGLLREIILVDFATERINLTELFKARLGQYL